jgi:DNA-directed RNA polymerase alpha subunit
MHDYELMHVRKLRQESYEEIIAKLREYGINLTSAAEAV